MPTENKPSEACWECLRRKVACDGTHPICTTCRSTGIVCPGYGDNRPLTWLPMGRVSRNQRPRVRTVVGSTKASAGAAKAAASKSGPSSNAVRLHKRTESDDADQCDAGSSQKGRSLALISGKRGPKKKEDPRQEENTISAIAKKHQPSKISIPIDLRPDDWDYIDLMLYHNQRVMPNLLSKYVAPCNGYMSRIEPYLLQAIPASTRYALLAANFGYRILDLSRKHNLYIVPTKSGPISELWQKFYRTIGLSLRALNDEIRQHAPGSHWNVIQTISFLISSEVGLCHTPVWRAHASGLFSMLEHSGGLRTIIEQPLTPRFFIQGFLVTMVVFNTTSPCHQQVWEIYNYEVEDLMSFYDLGFCPVFSCPGPIFRQILRINCLRVQSTKSPVRRKEDELHDIIKDIDTWSPSEWIEAKDMPRSKKFLIVASCFKAAAILYGLLALPPSPSTNHERKVSCKKLKNVHHAALFKFLRAAMDDPIVMDRVFWPLIVAGVEAKTGTWGEKEFVERYLRLGMKEPFTGKPVETALAVVNRFWTSDKTGWDDCFDQTYALVTI
ncbi:Phomenoic acid biosynthesis cluster-specific transcriptional regulator-like protein [Cladobotryum mycophilum]|uniref:Phomenoic acid biosynthesis cluster-specific transcriptional regulator-like protein n=1 Tax=Cladobotryum mycophilum TaxID=491253 RepID=A0ABR0SMY9_9HYPO